MDPHEVVERDKMELRKQKQILKLCGYTDDELVCVLPVDPSLDICVIMPISVMPPDEPYLSVSI